GLPSEAQCLVDGGLVDRDAIAVLQLHHELLDQIVAEIPVKRPPGRFRDLAILLLEALGHVEDDPGIFLRRSQHRTCPADRDIENGSDAGLAESRVAAVAPDAITGFGLEAELLRNRRKRLAAGKPFLDAGRGLRGEARGFLALPVRNDLVTDFIQAAFALWRDLRHFVQEIARTADMYRRILDPYIAFEHFLQQLARFGQIGGDAAILPQPGPVYRL